MIAQDYFIVATLVVCLYLAWRVYDIQNELDNLGGYSVKSIMKLAEAIDEIEDYLDEQEHKKD